MHRLACVACFFLVFNFMFGCASQNAPPPPTAKASGTVNLNGKPMAEGEIRFNIPGQPPKTFPITNGTFSGEIFIGKNRVDIVLEKDGGPNPTDPSVRIKINTVTHHDLQAEVTTSGTNSFTFEVTSAAP